LARVTEREVEREMAPEERTFVERLLDELGTRGDSFRAQLGGARIVQKCSCGCPSIHFVAERSDAPAPCEMILGNMGAVTSDGHKVGIWLFARGDRLYEVEIIGSPRLGEYPLPAAETIFREPPAAPPR
jgi:hypothetical protein